MAFEEYAYRTEVDDCSLPDHDIVWCGDCYACFVCGRKFYHSSTIKGFIDTIASLRNDLTGIKTVLTDLVKSV